MRTFCIILFVLMLATRAFAGAETTYTLWDQPYNGSEEWVSEAEGISLAECNQDLKDRRDLHFRGAHCAPTGYMTPTKAGAGLLASKSVTTVFAPAVFSNSLALWKLFSSQTYPTLEACQAVLPANRDAKCVPFSGVLPTD